VKISYNWLKRFLKIDLPIETLTSQLTNLGLEVESMIDYQSIKGGLEGVIVGKVVECKIHPNADRLKLTKVKIDKSTIVQIVCGAPNVKSGQKVVVATVGSKIYTIDGNEIKIKSAKIRGEESFGMICAEDELGIGHSHEGIIVLEDTAKIGTPCSEIFEVSNDYVMEIALTPNRADAMSHLGVARDLKAAFIQNNIPYEWSIPSVEMFPTSSNTKIIDVQVENPNLTPIYLGITLTNIKISPSPLWMRNLLKSIGITPKNNIVDITNYVLHELGQPLHSFDADKIEGSIIVKTLPEGKSFKTLDGIERKLHSSDLMICDEKKPLCIAGVFGGESSGVTNSTSSVFLESAYFDPISIRKTSKRHNLNTDASFRFERGIDPEITKYALKRACLLMIEHAGAIISSEIISVKKPPKEDLKIFLNFNDLNDTLGQHIPKEDLTRILKTLEIKIDNITDLGLSLTIPKYRVDVTRSADLIEEVLRIYGYDSIKPSNELKINYPKHDIYDEYYMNEKISEYLVARGYHEIISNSISKSYRSLDNIVDESTLVKILNPLGKELSELRTTLLFSGLEAISFNLNRQMKSINVFEIGKTYRKSKEKFIENKWLFIGLVDSIDSKHWSDGAESPSFFKIKGLIEGVLKLLGLENVKFNSHSNNIISNGLSIINKKNEIGYLGMVSKRIQSHFDINETIYICLINMDYVYSNSLNKTVVEEISKFPKVQRDFSLLIDKSISFQSILDISYKTEKNILQSVDLFDVYEGNNIPEDKKSYGVRFIFQDKRKTLTDKYVDIVMDKLKKQFIKELKAELR
tara:strand:+ start:985 stop:3402 length:2418 start_codon:yes stop_codon:yes gene_type:complete